MKVAIVGLRLTVGPRLIVDSIAPVFHDLGHEVVFFGQRDYSPPLSIPTIRVSEGATYLGMIRDIFRPGTYREVADALVAERPDLCYFVSVHPANGPLAWTLHRALSFDSRRSPPIAMHLHDPLPHPGMMRLAIFASQQIQVRPADRIVVYGASLARQVHRYYRVPESRIVAIRHGASRPPRAARPAEPPDYRWFSFLGRIEPYKGLEVFLAAAQRLRRANPACQFYIGGAGNLKPYRDTIRAVGGITIENRELTNDETDAVMQASWAVVLPYTSATQSGVIPVAYWNACPVITTRVGALEEVVLPGETGFIVEGGDAAGLSERMAVVSGDHALRRRLGNGAFSFYDRWLRWERIGAELLSRLAG